MDIIDSLDFIGLKDGIKKCFSSVFSELNVASEAWFQKTKLLTIGRDNYADYIATKVGVFPLFATSRSASVDSTYVRVNISTDIERERYRSTSEIEDALRRQKIGTEASPIRVETAKTPLQAIESTHSGFAIIGIPGSGKTTIFRYLCVEAARGRIIREKKRIPVYLAVRDLAIKSQGIIEAATHFFDRLEIKEADRVLDLLFKSGNCILLLDGVDETNKTNQKNLLSELFDLQAKYPQSLFCVSARPFSLSVGLPNFTKWETLPLAFEDRLTFIEKWFSSVDVTKGQRLLEKTRYRPEILDLGSNPLLLSIVCALFYNDLDIPSESDELYARAIHGILGGWDAFRNIARESIIADLPIRKRIVLVSWLAAYLFQANKIVFSPQDVESTGCLSRAEQALRMKLPEADELLSSLYNDFGLLVERAPGLYSFSHLTIHEFLVAQYIIDNRLEINLLSAHRKQQEWAEVIRLVAKMLPNANQFMDYIQTGTELTDLAQVSLLESIWSSKPICTPETTKKLMTQLAMKIAAASKSLPYDPKIDGTTLLMKPRFNEQDKGERKRMKEERRLTKLMKRSHEGDQTASIKLKRNPVRSSAKSAVIVNCLPSLLRILKASSYSYDELGVSQSKLFQELIQSKVSDVTSIRFISEKPDIPSTPPDRIGSEKLVAINARDFDYMHWDEIED